jgi:hypothetical protein
VKRLPALICAALLLFVSRMSVGTERHVPAHRRVDLIIGAAANVSELLEPSIRDLLLRKGLEVVTAQKTVVTAQDVAAAIAPPKEATASLARVLLDFTVPGQGTLFLIDPRRGRVYVRRMALPHGWDAVARASVELVVEQSIDAILEGREIGVSREEFQRTVLPPPTVAEAPSTPAAPPAAPVPASAPAPASAPSPTQLLLEAGAELVAMGSGQYQQAAKVAVAARMARVEIAVGARLAAPISITGDGVQARLWTGGITLSGAGRPLSRGNLAVMAGLAAGLDFTRVTPAVTTLDLQPATAFWAAGPSLEPFAGVERMFGRISVSVAAGAEIHLLAERYSVRTGTETRAVFVPARVRPAAALLVGAVF